MTSLTALLVSLILHAVVFSVFSYRVANPEFAFRKGEIAMDLLESGAPYPASPKATDNVGVPAEKTASSGSQSPPGIQSGSALGITAPEYPEKSRINGEEGEVIIAFELDDTEMLVSNRIESSSGFEAIDRSALKAVEAHYAKSSSPTSTTLKRVRFKFSLAK